MHQFLSPNWLHSSNNSLFNVKLKLADMHTDFYHKKESHSLRFWTCYDQTLKYRRLKWSRKTDHFSLSTTITFTLQRNWCNIILHRSNKKEHWLSFVCNDLDVIIMQDNWARNINWKRRLINYSCFFVKEHDTHVSVLPFSQNSVLL